MIAGFNVETSILGYINVKLGYGHAACHVLHENGEQGPSLRNSE